MSYAKNNPELKRGMSKRTSLTTPHIYQVSEEEKPHLIIRSQYDPHNHFRNLLQYRGTVTQLLVTSPLFWFINVLNVIVFVSWKYLAEDHKQRVLGQWHLKISYMQPMGSFVVFLVVFYTSNCFANYKDLFHFGCKLQHSISLFAVQLKSVLRSPGGYLVSRPCAEERAARLSVLTKYVVEPGVAVRPSHDLCATHFLFRREGQGR